MCRLAAFPPGFTAEQAIEILRPFTSWNDDGVGTAYVDAAGRMVVNKAPMVLEKALAAGCKLFDHMPHSGWTIAHLRAASHGDAELVNTHPFVKGDWAFCHNGIWSGYRLAKALIPSLEVDGETDTEVAAALWAHLGPDGFVKAIQEGGVYLALESSGQVIVYVTHGDLEYKRLENGTFLLASRLPSDMKKVRDVETGWMQLGPDGRVTHMSAKTSARTAWAYGAGYSPAVGHYENGAWRGYQQHGLPPTSEIVSGSADGDTDQPTDDAPPTGYTPPDDRRTSPLDQGTLWPSE